VSGRRLEGSRANRQALERRTHQHAGVASQRLDERVVVLGYDHQQVEIGIKPGITTRDRSEDRDTEVTPPG